MNNLFEQLSDTHKGIFLIIIGTILLLHTLKLIERGLNIIIIIGSLITIFYGIFLLARHDMIKSYYQKMIARITKERPKK